MAGGRVCSETWADGAIACQSVALTHLDWIIPPARLVPGFLAALSKQ